LGREICGFEGGVDAIESLADAGVAAIHDCVRSEIYWSWRVESWIVGLGGRWGWPRIELLTVGELQRHYRKVRGGSYGKIEYPSIDR